MTGKIPRIVIADSTNHEMPADRRLELDIPLNADILTPRDAVNWLAFESFGMEMSDAVRHWMNWTWVTKRDLSIRASGRLDLALELIETALREGRLNCAFVEEEIVMPKLAFIPRAKLVVIPGSELASHNLNFEWDDDLTIQIDDDSGNDEDGGTVEEISDFCLFWHEIIRMRTGADPVDYLYGLPPDSPETLTAPRQIEASDRTGDNSATVRLLPSRKPPGQKAAQHGEPIAIATLALAGLDEGRLEALKAETVAYDLVKLYEKCGEKVPNADSLRKSAQGILRAVRRSRISTVDH